MAEPGFEIARRFQRALSKLRQPPLVHGCPGAAAKRKSSLVPEHQVFLLALARLRLAGLCWAGLGPPTAPPGRDLMMWFGAACWTRVHSPCVRWVPGWVGCPPPCAGGHTSRVEWARLRHRLCHLRGHGSRSATSRPSPGPRSHSVHSSVGGVGQGDAPRSGEQTARSTLQTRPDRTPEQQQGLRVCCQQGCPSPRRSF